jgi:hypothetical protein
MYSLKGSKALALSWVPTAVVVVVLATTSVLLSIEIPVVVLETSVKFERVVAVVDSAGDAVERGKVDTFFVELYIGTD